ncbi:hypothetical protein GDS87_13190 [Lysinibacillus pakistanensis]|uniref:Uncharacterized protein n=1 Tax=Lysinibacillus pakistanensis TaxID=759811 RepID=A0ABX6DB13_9BACI|nr:hypothetical protein GDS87_13190 [Lysinibacillus pakistanensis]
MNKPILKVKGVVCVENRFFIGIINGFILSAILWISIFGWIRIIKYLL